MTDDDREPPPEGKITHGEDGEPILLDPPDKPALLQHPDWPRATYFMLKAVVHALRAVGDPGVVPKGRWWATCIDAEYEAMVAAGEARPVSQNSATDEEEGHPEG